YFIKKEYDQLCKELNVFRVYTWEYNCRAPEEKEQWDWIVRNGRKIEMRIRWRLNEPLAEEFLIDSEGPCFCKPFYQDLDPDKFPDPDLLKQIQSGEVALDGEGGILLTGKTGAGKTMAGWEILRRYLGKHYSSWNIYKGFD